MSSSSFGSPDRFFLFVLFFLLSTNMYFMYFYFTNTREGMMTKTAGRDDSAMGGVPGMHMGEGGQQQQGTTRGGQYHGA
jgi:hypothetical protein